MKRALAVTLCSVLLATAIGAVLGHVDHDALLSHAQVCVPAYVATTPCQHASHPPQNDPRGAFDSWLSISNKLYPSEEVCGLAVTCRREPHSGPSQEAQQRYAVWLDNLAFVNAHNALGKSYKVHDCCIPVITTTTRVHSWA